MKRARPKNRRAAKNRREIRKRLQNTNTLSGNVSGENRDLSEFSGRNANSGSKKAKKSKKIWKIIIILIAILVFVVMGFGLFDDSEILAPIEDGKINVLLMGVDEEGLRTDAIMLISYDVNEAKVNMLSIPRDTKLYVSNRKMTRKINEIHGMGSKVKSGEIVGATATAEAVTQLTGLPVNYYVEFSFSAIDRVFDILGPVKFDVPDVEGGGRGMNYDDPTQNLHIHLKPGLQKLSGNQVQQFLRYRKSNSGRGDGSDTSRVERQQAFLKAVVDQKVNAGILVKVPSLFAQLSKEIETNITAGDITKYIRYLTKLSSENINSYSLPGASKTISGGSYYICDLEATAVLMRDVFGSDNEITDKVTISDEHSQKVLKAGNKNKTAPTKTPDAETEASVKGTEKPANEETVTPTNEPAVTKAPTKAPVVTKEPTNSPAPTKTPSAKPTKTPEANSSQSPAPEKTKTPLEDLDENYEVIE